MKKLRAFLAVDLVDVLRDRVVEIISQLAPVSTNVKWVEPENLHVTLKFLGDIDDVEAWKVSQAVSDVVKSHRRFPVTFATVGAFPTLDNPRTLWIGLSEGEPPFVALAESVDRALRALGYASEQRRFHPHLTLGRVRGRQDASLRARLEELSHIELGSMQVDAVTLYSSQLRKTGPTYSRMATLRLKG